MARCSDYSTFSAFGFLYHDIEQKPVHTSTGNIFAPIISHGKCMLPLLGPRHCSQAPSCPLRPDIAVTPKFLSGLLQSRGSLLVTPPPEGTYPDLPTASILATMFSFPTKPQRILPSRIACVRGQSSGITLTGPGPDLLIDS